MQDDYGLNTIFSFLIKKSKQALSLRRMRWIKVIHYLDLKASMLPLVIKIIHYEKKMSATIEGKNRQVASTTK